MSALVVQRIVSDIIDEYDFKVKSLEEEIRLFEQAVTRMTMAGTIAGTYTGPVIHGNPYVYERSVLENLRKSGWRTMYNRLQIEKIASAKDKKNFEFSLQNPPELTFDNVKSTFGDYFLRPRFHALRGLAETFCALSPAYRSHSNVKIGVKGLPRRIILNSYGPYSSYTKDSVANIVNALASLRGEPLMTDDERRALSYAHRSGKSEFKFDGSPVIEKDRYKDTVHETLNRGISVKFFGNGNLHVIFDAKSLRDINLGLAEFYGDVLPDVEEEDAPKPTSREVAKDLQYYWTPDSVIDSMFSFGYISTEKEYNTNKTALEPSCGDGRILDYIRKAGIKVTGIEYHRGRVEQAKAKGHTVIEGNFLEIEPETLYDYVLMNPPFYGTHWKKHVEHSLKFLKPEGTLISVLPATAHYNHDFTVEGYNCSWQDLPVASFRESGTNVPTILLKMKKRKW